MIEVRCDHGDMDMHIKGDIPELCADMMTIINAVWHSIFEDNTISATFFRTYMEQNIGNAFVLMSKEVEEDE